MAPGGGFLEKALGAYEQWRNAGVMPMYEFTYQLAKLEAPSAKDEQVFGALRTDQYEADHRRGIAPGRLIAGPPWRTSRGAGLD